MAKERCSSCDGSGWLDRQHNKLCQRCNGAGRVEVPGRTCMPPHLNLGAGDAATPSPHA
jgi:DnaJ-class molecular chaperone